MTSENAEERGGGDATRPENYDASMELAEQPSSLPDEVEELAEPGQRSIGRLFTSSMSVVSGDPIASKINESHLTDMIGLMGKGREYEHVDRHRSRIFWGIMVAFVILVAVAFAVFLALNGMDSLLSELVKGGALFLSGAAAGFGGGYGLARRNR